MWRKYLRYPFTDLFSGGTNSTQTARETDDQQRKEYDARRSYETHQTRRRTEDTQDDNGLPPKPVADDEERKKQKKLLKQRLAEEAKLINQKPWYHGYMPRDEIETMLKKDGDYLVRMTDNGERGSKYEDLLAISVWWAGRPRHFLCRCDSHGRWMIRPPEAFDTIEALITDYREKGKTVQVAHGTKFIQPVCRPDWYLLHEHIALGEKLGCGSFGDVFRAELTLQDGKKVDCAAKMLKGCMGKQDRSTFVKEASLNRRFNHPNVIRLLGIATQMEPIIVVLELAPGGSLRSYCRDHHLTLTVSELTRFILDSAKGLEYLADMDVIHRDIAARNCLLTSELVVKISDFGLSVLNNRRQENKGFANRAKNGVLGCGYRFAGWLPKPFRRRCSAKRPTFGLLVSFLCLDADILGILMWEVYTRCQNDPYSGKSNSDAKRSILAGTQLKMADDTPDFATKLMADCWKMNPDQRPTFGEIVIRLKKGTQPASTAGAATAGAPPSAVGTTTAIPKAPTKSFALPLPFGL